MFYSPTAWAPRVWECGALALARASAADELEGTSNAADAFVKTVLASAVLSGGNGGGDGNGEVAARLAVSRGSVPFSGAVAAALHLIQVAYAACGKRLRRSLVDTCLASLSEPGPLSNDGAARVLALVQAAGHAATAVLRPVLRWAAVGVAAAAAGDHDGGWENPLLGAGPAATLGALASVMGETLREMLESLWAALGNQIGVAASTGDDDDDDLVAMDTNVSDPNPPAASKPEVLHLPLLTLAAAAHAPSYTARLFVMAVDWELLAGVAVAGGDLNSDHRALGGLLRWVASHRVHVLTPVAGEVLTLLAQDKVVPLADGLVARALAPTPPDAANGDGSGSNEFGRPRDHATSFLRACGKHPDALATLLLLLQSSSDPEADDGGVAIDDGSWHPSDSLCAAVVAAEASFHPSPYFALVEQVRFLLLFVLCFQCVLV